LAFVDIRISYEREITPSHGIIFSLGYKPGFKHFTDATYIDLGQNSTAWCYGYTATSVYASLGYRYYFKPNKKYYISPELFWRNLKAYDITYSYGIGSGTKLRQAYEIQSMKTKVRGLNLLIGKKFIKKSQHRFSYGLDINVGVSMRIKSKATTIYGATTAYYYHDSPPRQVTIPRYGSPFNEESLIFQFSPQVCIRFLLAW
jgi:hypothetical protein